MDVCGDGHTAPLYFFIMSGDRASSLQTDGFGDGLLQVIPMTGHDFEALRRKLGSRRIYQLVPMAPALLSDGLMPCTEKGHCASKCLCLWRRVLLLAPG